MKKLLVHARALIKFFSIVAISIVIIAAIVIFVYKPTYSVYFKGEFVGYTNDKNGLQNKINEYIKNGEGEHVAFVQIDELPEYEMCLLKKQTETNDDEIFEKIKETGTVYYKYYAVTESSEEKAYVATSKEAEEIIEGLNDKKSYNKDDIAYIEKYSTELAEFSEVDAVIDDLYEAPPIIYYASNEANLGGSKVNLGISLIHPVSGIITSRFGSRWGSTHTGLDVATDEGTGIAAAASGTVRVAGWSGSYGNLVIVSHGNGVETWYAHCSAIYVNVGQSVSQGQLICAVGETGNATGPHLHLEIRVNGVAQNPQNYLY